MPQGGKLRSPSFIVGFGRALSSDSGEAKAVRPHNPPSLVHFRELPAQAQAMKNYPAAGQQFSFHADLENWAEGMDYCAIPVPAEVTEALGTKGPVLVLARVNDSEPFQVSLFPVGGGRHYIRIKAKVRRETNTKTGDRIRMRITVLDRENVEVPADLTRALRAEGVVEAFQSLPPGKQSFIIRRIDEAAKPETRERRIQEGVAAAHQRREKLMDKPGSHP